MKKLNILFIPEKLRWKILIRWSTEAIPHLAEPCTLARTAVTSSLLLFAVTAAFVLPEETNMLLNAPPVCLSNSSTSGIAIAFLPYPGLTSMTEIPLLSTITATRMNSMWKKLYLSWISSNDSFVTSRKNILKWSGMAVCMQDTVRFIQNCAGLSQRKSTGYTGVSLNGEPLFFSLSDMTLSIALSVIIKWSLLNSITAIARIPRINVRESNVQMHVYLTYVRWICISFCSSENYNFL